MKVKLKFNAADSFKQKDFSNKTYTAQKTYPYFDAFSNCQIFCSDINSRNELDETNRCELELIKKTHLTTNCVAN